MSATATIEYCLARRSSLLAILFIAYGLTGCLGAAVLMPPFANIDEAVHFMRADQISLGGLIGERRLPDRSGGMIHGDILKLDYMIWSTLHDVDHRIDSDELKDARAITWDGRLAYVSFPTSSFYPPTSYVPGVIGILLGRAANLGIAATLLLARAMDAIAYVIVGALAVASAGAAAPALFTVLLLPTSIVQGASVSQDSLLIALSGLAAALTISNLCEHPHSGLRRMLLLSIVIGAIVTARPPYLPLAALPLLISGTALRLRLTCFILIVTVCLLWSLMMAMFVAVPLPIEGGTSDVPHQAGQLLLHPMNVASATLQTLISSARYKYIEFVGLGLWWLPLEYYTAAGVILALTVALCMLSPRRVAWWPYSPMICALVVTSAILVFIACYLFTHPGAPGIVGVQGRYFIPLALLVPAMVPCIQPRMKTVPALALGVVALFPAISIATLLYSIVWRFYLAP